MYKKVRTLDIPVSPEVAAFAVVMEAKLQMNGYDHLQSWEKIPLPALLKQIELQVERLKKLDFTNENPHKVFEAVVVLGSLSMMMAELSSRRKDGAVIEKDAQKAVEEAFALTSKLQA